MKNNLAIITARGGSKRIPGKNIRPFLGQPIIAYSIRAAVESGCFDEVMVSTDSAEIAGIARSLGAVVPFLRSPETSDDTATTADALREVILRYQAGERFFENICCLFPTAPLVTPDTLRKGHAILEAKPECDAVFPVVRFSFPIQRAFRIREDRLEMFQPENEFVHSRDLEPAYHDAGQFYWIRTALFLSSGKVYGRTSVPIVLNESEVQDIDTEEDWKMAEIKFELLARKTP